MDKINDFIERLDKIIQAYEKCNEADSCDGCPYDGICATKSFALENDAVDLLEEVVCSVEMDKAVCLDICGTSSMIRDWIAKMQCAFFTEEEDGFNESDLLCLVSETEHKLADLLKEIKTILLEKK